MKKLSDKQKLLTVALVGALLVIVLSATYAFFSYTRAGTTENTIKSGSITFLYDELNQEGNSIAITDAMPMTDTEGKAQDKYFNFKIVSRTGNTNSIPYDITVRKKDGSDNLDNYVKIYLAKIDNYNTTIANETEVALDTYAEYQSKSINNYIDKLIYSDVVPASNDSFTQFYRLKMWIDNDTPLSNETMNKTFTLTVNVYANGHLLDANSAVATVNSVSVGGTELTATSTSNGIDYYEATLPEGTMQTTLSVDTGDYTNVRIIKTQSDYSTPIAMNGEITRLAQTLSKRVSLTNGANYFKIIATSEDRTDSKEIHAKITVAKYVRIFNRPYELKENTDEDGLYSMLVTSGFGGLTEPGITYYFKGPSNDNYISFAGLIWRIVRINEDGTIRIALNTSIGNQEFYGAAAGMAVTYYINSNVKGTIDNWYSNNIANNDIYVSKIAVGDYFCEAFKVFDGQYGYNRNSDPNATSASAYTPDLACRVDVDGHGWLNVSAALLTYDEARLGANTFVGTSWTMSSAGGNGNVGYVWGTDLGVKTTKFNAACRFCYPIVPVINLKADVTATGTGTEQDPYVIQ